MKKVCKVLVLVLALYLAASVVFSVVHANVEHPWEFRQHRNGLLCVEFCEDGGEWEFVVYSPFCNWADVFLLVAAVDEDGFWCVSDGFDSFGEWNIN